MPGTLYLVATPIGNLQDMSPRAVETLRAMDVVACEDTRHTRKLLTHFAITAKLVSYHEHNEAERAAELSRLLEAGKSVAVVSDAGTPAISDPSYHIVLKAIELGVPVVPIPGPAAFVCGVIASGLPTDSVFFGGFLPSKAGDRRKRLTGVRDVPATLTFYESPHRLARSLSDCLAVLGDRRAAVARELTKLHEEIRRGSLKELTEHFSKNANIKGEIVLIIERGSGTESRPKGGAGDLSERVETLQRQGFDRKTALKMAAKEFGMTRSDAYRTLQAEKNTGT